MNKKYDTRHSAIVTGNRIAELSAIVPNATAIHAPILYARQVVPLDRRQRRALRRVHRRLNNRFMIRALTL
jgi:hypothetical protein